MERMQQYNTFSGWRPPGDLPARTGRAGRQLVRHLSRESSVMTSHPSVPGEEDEEEEEEDATPRWMCPAVGLSVMVLVVSLLLLIGMPVPMVIVGAAFLEKCGSSVEGWSALWLLLEVGFL